jgi:DNA modification methylase
MASIDTPALIECEILWRWGGLIAVGCLVIMATGRIWSALVCAIPKEGGHAMRVEQLSDDVTLYLGDCREILPTLGKVDACVTDPPYGIGLAGGFSGAVGFSGAGGFSKPIARREYSGDWDDHPPCPETFKAILSACDQAIIWGGNYFTDRLPLGPFWLVWDKQNTMPTFSDAELAWTNIDKKSVKRLVYQQNGLMSKEKERFHPTQKAAEVMRWSITHLKAPADTILDPFMGSGTTGVACVQLGRKFIGIELEPRYFDIACRRISDEIKRPRLPLDDPKPTPKQVDLF